MASISKLLDRTRSKFDYRQPVYIPGYEYSPWKKWLSIAVVALVILLVIAGFFGNLKPAKGNNENTNSIALHQQSKQQAPSGVGTTKANIIGPYEVVKVVDGDTIDVTIDGKTERLRLIGIDTPETVDPRKTVQCFGTEASNKAKVLLTGKSVYVEADPSQDNRDKYNRLLRYVYFVDKTSYNKLMISEGYAHEYTYYIPYKYQADYKQAEKDAQNNKRGLWSPSSCNGNTTQSTTTSTASANASTNSSSKSTSLNSGSASSACNPNYSPCVKNSAYDLDCPDIGFQVHVIGTDVYRLDRDGDKIGCDSY